MPHLGVIALFAFSIYSLTTSTLTVTIKEVHNASVGGTTSAQKTATSITKNKKKLWCVLDNQYLQKNTRLYLNHFPHAMEAILPCYSEFIERGSIKTTVDTGEDASLATSSILTSASNCGYFITGKTQQTVRYKALQHKTDKTQYVEIFPPYAREVLHAMGCDLILADGSVADSNLTEAENEFFIPNNYLGYPRLGQIRYLNHPDHAQPLRRQFVSDDYIKSIKGEGKPLQIGMIQRPKGRRIDNFEQVRDELKKRLPDCNITYDEFNYTNVKDQAEWFATKDVIIGAHGAAFINSLWITPKTIVQQIYPPHAFFASLEPLIEQVGGIAIQAYNKSIGDPYVAAKSVGPNERNRAMINPFSVDVTDVVQRVIYALGVKLPFFNETEVR